MQERDDLRRVQVRDHRRESLFLLHLAKGG